MTVQELIDELSKIKNKWKEVTAIHTSSDDEYKVIEIDEYEDDVTIWLNENISEQ